MVCQPRAEAESLPADPRARLAGGRSLHLDLLVLPAAKVSRFAACLAANHLGFIVAAPRNPSAIMR
jgi:hypothetical protein